MVKDKSKKGIQKDAYKKSQNVFYVLKHIWKWDKVYYVAYIPKIFISVFMPLALLYYPKLLIDSIMNKSSDTYILSVIALYSFMLIITGIIQLFADAKINSTSYTFAIIWLTSKPKVWTMKILKTQPSMTWKDKLTLAPQAQKM